MNARTRDAGFGPEVKRRIMLGTYALSAGYYDAYYGQAQRVRTLIIRDFARAYEQFDVLLSPTSPTVAFELGAKTADPLAMYLSDVCTIPTNLAGHPAISVPFGDRRGRAAHRRAGARARAGRAGDVPRRPVLEATRPAHTAMSGGGTKRSSGSRCTASSRPRRSCSAGAATSSAPSPTPTCARCASALPGSLPVLNEQAVEFALRFAEAVHLHVPERSTFARKNYFYPDMPKDYQVSQYDEPITIDGWIDIDGARASASSARTSRRTPARRSTSVAAVASTTPTTRSSTTTAPACR